MTLSVCSSWIDDAGVEHELEPRFALAGFESMRNTFYGSPQAIERGLHLLPRLRDEAVIEISPESFDALLAEVDVLEALAREEGTYEPYWCHRLGNLRAAVASARAYGSMGRVSIG